MSISVLVVTKSKDTTELVKQAVSKLECQVIYANRIGLGLFLARKNFPSLILLERDLADGSGLDLALEVKADPDLAHLPVILIEKNRSESQFKPSQLGPKIDRVLNLPKDAPTLLLAIEPYLLPVRDKRLPETTE